MDERDGLFRAEAEYSAPAPPPEAEEEDGPKPRRGAELFDWLRLFIGCVVVTVFLFNCVARLTRVDGSSMDNTLKHGEIMLIWSLGYQPRQGDIVVLNKTSAILPNWTEPRAIVKRVIATGGQTVDIDYTTGTVYVDGTPLDEPYIKEEMYHPGYSTMSRTHWEVPAGSIFVMGDNRNNSTDSRDDRLGTIDEDYVLGKVIFGLWPLDRLGPI